MNPIRANLIAKSLVEGNSQKDTMEKVGYCYNPATASRYCNHPLVLEKIQWYKNRLQKNLDITVADLANPLQKIINNINGTSKDRDIIQAISVLANLLGFTNGQSGSNAPSIVYNFNVVPQSEIDARKHVIDITDKVEINESSS